MSYYPFHKLKTQCICSVSFFSDEECERLIELGEEKGYRRSTEYSDTTNVDGSSEFVESKGRTSLNTFCQEGCDDDPVVKRVIERMTQMTAVPYDNYESLQLVRYSEGQFYQYVSLSVVRF